MAGRLNKEDWLQFGLTCLAREGPEALKANSLCKALGVTRGSFYWHFEDIDAFHTALIAYWQNQTSDAVVAQLPPASAEARLLALLAQAASSDDNLERAMRTWRKVQNVLEALDRVRVAHLSTLLQDCGVIADHAQARAHFLYWANIGRIMSHAPADTVSHDALESIVRALIA